MLLYWKKLVIDVEVNTYVWYMPGTTLRLADRHMLHCATAPCDSRASIRLTKIKPVLSVSIGSPCSNHTKHQLYYGLYFQRDIWNWRITVYKNCLIVDFSGNKCFSFEVQKYFIVLPSRPSWKVAIRHAAIAYHEYVNVGCLKGFHSEGWTILLSHRQICRSLVANPGLTRC